MILTPCSASSYYLNPSRASEIMGGLTLFIELVGGQMKEPVEFHFLNEVHGDAIHAFRYSNFYKRE